MTVDQEQNRREERAHTFKADYKWARTAFQRGEYDAAATLCRQILDLDPREYSAAGLYAASRQKDGRSAREIEELARQIATGEKPIWKYLMLAELQRCAGNSLEAIRTLEQASADGYDIPAIRLALGVAHYDRRELKQAEALLHDVIGEDPDLAPAHYYLGNIRAHEEDWSGAIESYAAALDADPDYHNAGLELADLLFRRRRDKSLAPDLGRAADLVLRAVEQGAGGFEGLLLAGKILAELSRFSEARALLEAAAAGPENHPDLYVALSVTYLGLGEPRRARKISRKLLREFPIGYRRCAKPEAEVLVLESLGWDAFTKPLYGSNTHAHANAIAALPPERVSLGHVFIQGLMLDQLAALAEKFDVVYNDIANAEINAERGYSKAVRLLLDRTGLPVVNTPEAIDLTARDLNYQRLRHVDHLIFPQTVKVTPESHNIDALTKQIRADFEFPLVVRRANFHRSDWVERVEESGGLRNALARFIGNPCYVIQYHESRYSDETYVKYRGIFIGGRFFPGRMNISGSWLVGASSKRPADRKLIEGNEAFQRAEGHWLSDPAAVIGQANIDALYAADSVIGLDNYGMDLGIADDGRVILFEANPCMNFLSIQRHVAKFPYLAPAAEAIKNAIAETIIAKANEKRSGTAKPR